MENKNIENKLWFKAKRYGWGWTPCSWEGWTVIGLYLLGAFLHFQNIDKFANSASDSIFNFTIPFIINTIFLIIISYSRGEKPKWRWGEK